MLRFQNEKVRKLAKDILDARLLNVKYDPETFPDLSKRIGEDIITAIKGSRQYCY